MKFQGFFASLALGVATFSVQAAPITDTVIVEDEFGVKEWAQVDLFTNLSWNEIELVCAARTCSDGTLNGFDMSGWVWASVLDVSTLFQALTPHPEGISGYSEVNSTWASAFFDDAGFEPTQHIPGKRSIAGWTRSNAPSDPQDPSVSYAPHLINNYATSLPDIVDTTVVDEQSTASLSRGAWFMRAPVTVPEPSAGALLVLAFLGFGWQRYRQHR